MIETLAEQALPTTYAFLMFMIVYFFGVLRERRRTPKPPYKPPPSLHCGCGDELSFHEGLGRCVKIETKWVAKDPATHEHLYVDRPCGCLQYTGDLPEDWWSRMNLNGSNMPELPAPAEEREES